MAAMAAAQLLDELMGRNRNTNPNDKPQKINWEDPMYCKYYMVKFCPHDLFINTRADLGACQRIHDDEVKKLFEKSEPCYKKSYYQEEFLRFCQNMINDVERKIQKGKQRLELMNDKSQHAAMITTQIRVLSDKIAKLEAETEEAGIRGDVEQAQGLMKMCDQLKDEREQLQKQSENSTHSSATAELAAAQEKQMEVCTVCGAFLIVGDAQQRIDDHLMGKQHVGYFRLKEAFDEITKEREKQRSEKERKRREDHDKERDGRKDRDRDRDRERERERDKERRGARGDRDRDRERDRDKDRNDRDNKDRNRNNSRSSRDEKRSSKSYDSRDHERKHRNDKDKNERIGRERSKDRSENRRKRSRSRGH